ncbi:hypothetical protein AB1I63_01715 [Streptococcus pneumoniae]
MRRRISQGKVEGITNPNDAKKIIRKGSVTYKQAHLIARGGNLTSISYDVLDGSIQSLPGAGISFVIVLAQAKWAGASTEEAVGAAFEAGFKTLAISTIAYASSQQIAKIMTARLRTQLGSQTLNATTVAGKVAPVISLGVMIGPDLFDAVSGRISSQQLLKNVAVAGAGVAASAAAGAAVGTILGPVGSIAGAVIGGIGGSALAKGILDQFIIDDRIEMFAQLKEEYIELVMIVGLSSDEFSKLQEKIFNKDLESLLKTMFSRKENSREYARQFIEERLHEMMQNRAQISNSDVLEAVKISESLFDASLQSA